MLLSVSFQVFILTPTDTTTARYGQIFSFLYVLNSLTCLTISSIHKYTIRGMTTTISLLYSNARIKFNCIEAMTAFVIPQPQHSIPNTFLNKQIECLLSNLSSDTKESKKGNKKRVKNMHVFEIFLKFPLNIAIFTFFICTIKLTLKRLEIF